MKATKRRIMQFRSVPMGSLFEGPSTDLYMKMKTVTLKDGTKANAVCALEGDLVYLDSKEPVVVAETSLNWLPEPTFSF